MEPSTQIQVYFGRHVIAEYVADEERASRYVKSIRRRFAGLRVELHPASPAVVAASDLPEEWQWGWPPT